MSLCKIKILLMCCSIVLTSCSSKSSQEVNNYNLEKTKEIESKDSPQLIIENPIFKFGSIKNNEKIKHVFYIKNIGKAPLIINSTVPSCGCTVAAHPKKPILFNQRDSIVVTFSTESLGVQNKTINISSNDKDIHKLTLIGNVNE